MIRLLWKPGTRGPTHCYNASFLISLPLPLPGRAGALRYSTCVLLLCQCCAGALQYRRTLSTNAMTHPLSAAGSASYHDRCRSHGVRRLGLSQQQQSQPVQLNGRVPGRDISTSPREEAGRCRDRMGAGEEIQ
ncbi:hypothetical protein EXIGLDRAFT_112447 [Exidia glandulosa HHB12029]|uniref:Uncharacterized protein n=1 Tax=Exidia glandulosa HHB12029 TaxID=1314781 RepID=A0A165NMB1_EXIGL|nr:hypothetical protein EXIGLDRAFT_112447 [Exidia glandulosa HHB12029]